MRLPAREEVNDMRVEAFDYYEGESIPVPAPVPAEEAHDL